MPKSLSFFTFPYPLIVVVIVAAVESFLRQTDIGEYYKTRHAATEELLLCSPDKN